MNLHDFFEFRADVEPKAAWFAAKRGTDQEMPAHFGIWEKEEELISAGQDPNRDGAGFPQIHRNGSP